MDIFSIAPPDIYHLTIELPGGTVFQSKPETILPAPVIDSLSVEVDEQTARTGAFSIHCPLPLKVTYTM